MNDRNAGTGTAQLGRFGAGAEIESVRASFRRDGAIVFDGLWQAERIENFRHQLATLHPELFDEALIDPEKTLNVSEGRHVVPLALLPDVECFDLLLQPDVSAFLEDQLGRDWVFEAVGVIVSFPGAPAQGIHRDGALLYGEVDRLLPPYAITLAIPLRPMDAVWGSTGLMLGSQLDFKATGEEGMVEPEIGLGSCILWNFLVRHRGLPNRAQEPRPLLYVTACRQFWVDERNFSARQRRNKLMIDPAVLNGLGKEHRRRFCRAVETT